MRTLEQGFSLIELVLVVGILGVLASIAIPNYQGFVQKAHNSEAKSYLAAVYMGERDFHLQYGVYSARFDAIGVFPIGNIYFNYSMDWDNPSGPPPDAPWSNINCTDLCSSPNIGIVGCWGPGYTCQDTAAYGSDTQFSSFAFDDSFLTEAYARFNDVPYTFTIDQNHNLVQVIPAN